MLRRRRPSPPAATYRLLTDVLATVPHSDGVTCARLLIALAQEALTLGDTDVARRHLADALRTLPERAHV